MLTRSSGRKPIAAPAPSEGAGRRWAFRSVAATIVPLAFFVVVEAGLRLAGFGYPTSFVLRDVVDGRRVFRDNPDFTRRFFGPHLVRTPRTFAVSAEKPAGTFRIVVLGESAAMGDPAPAFGFPRLLEVMLAQHHPGRRFEVVNAAVTSINSHAVLEIARDCVALHPDLYVLYMGNNEVVGPYGVGTAFRPVAGRIGVIRTQLALQTLRIGQAMDRLARTFGAHRNEPAHWEGMSMFLGHEVRASDPALSLVHAHFRRNLEDILDVAQHSGIPVVLSTVGVNLKDSAPFASEHRADLAPADEKRWQSELEAGVALENGGQWPEALQAYARAAAIDAEPADLAYRQGRCLYALGQYTSARAAFERALELDVLRFRADGTINRTIREVAAAWRDSGVRFADTEEAFRRESPHGIPGRELLHEHVHMTFAGNYVIARELIAAMAPLLPESAGTLPSLSECAQRLGLTEWHRVKILHDVLERLQRPPFLGQIDNAEARARIESQLDELRPHVAPDRLTGMVADLTALAAHAPEWDVHENLAILLDVAGRHPEAIAEWRQVLQRVPHYMEGHANLAKVLFREGRTQEALAELERARNLRPDAAEPYDAIGAVHASEGRWPEAFAAYERALSIDPTSRDTLINLAMAYGEQKRIEDARLAYRKAAQQPAYTAESEYQLALCAQAIDLAPEARDHARAALALNAHHRGAYELLMEAFRKMGEVDEAAAFLRGLLSKDAGRADAHVTLGEIEEARGHLDEAVGHYEKARELDPLMEKAYFASAGLLGQRRRFREATEILEDGVHALPDSEAMWQRLASVSMELDPARAIGLYRHVHERWPGDWTSVSNLAWILATAAEARLRNGNEAVSLAEEAVRLTGGREPQALNALGAALAEAHRFSEAQQAAQAAMQAAAAAGQPDLAVHIRSLLALYEKGQSYPPGASRSR